MSKFRKKPVVIEAWRLPINVVWDDIIAAPHWVRSEKIQFFETNDGPNTALRTVATIATLEGQMRAEPGDWIIQGIKGEIYPCKPDIFAAAYEPVL
jgi:hypothetical protein